MRDGEAPAFLPQTLATAAVASAHARRRAVADASEAPLASSSTEGASDAVSAGVVNANRNLLSVQARRSHLRPRKFSVRLAHCGEGRTCVQADREHGAVTVSRGGVSSRRLSMSSSSVAADRPQTRDGAVAQVLSAAKRALKRTVNKLKRTVLPASLGGVSHEYAKDGSGVVTTLKGRALQGSMSMNAARVWALRNTNALEDGWRIFEFSFYRDEACTEHLEYQNLVESGHFEGLAYGPEKATDGYVNTMWVASCGRAGSTKEPCQPLEARIGMDFGMPVVVHCAKIHQTEYFAGEITLSKEGTTVGIGGNLWVDV